MKITPALRCAACVLSLLGLVAASVLAQPVENPPEPRRTRERAAAVEGGAASAAERRRERRRRAEPDSAASTSETSRPSAATATAAAQTPASAGASATVAAAVSADPELFWRLLDGRDEAALEALLRADPGLAKAVSKNGYPALVLAGTAAVARLLLNAGADPNVEDSRGTTALQAAARAGNERRRQVVLVLLEAGAHTNFKPGTISPLLRAAETGDKAVVGALLARGLPVDDGVPAGKDSPLIEAVRGGHGELVEFLLGKGAAIEHKGDGGKTALARAAFDTRIEIVKLLLARKADINAGDKDGTTPLAYLLLRRNQPPEVEQKIAATAAYLREMGAREQLRTAATSATASTGPARSTGPAPSATGGAGVPVGASQFDRVVQTTIRTAKALKYDFVADNSRSATQSRIQFAKGSPKVTLSTEVIQRSNGSVRLTGVISCSDASQRREAIRQFRAVLAQLLGVPSLERAGFDIDGNINE